MIGTIHSGSIILFRTKESQDANLTSTKTVKPKVCNVQKRIRYI